MEKLEPFELPAPDPDRNNVVEIGMVLLGILGCEIAGIAIFLGPQIINMIASGH